MCICAANWPLELYRTRGREHLTSDALGEGKVPIDYLVKVAKFKVKPP